MNTRHNRTTITREWFTAKEIKNERKKYEVRQVTCFLLSKDNELLLVSKNFIKWSVTAGHFEKDKDKTFKDTAIREIYEESGLDISKYRNEIKFLGYCIVRENDTYIQVRMFLKLHYKDSEESRPKPVDGDTVKIAKFHSIEQSLEKVTWLANSDGWRILKSII